MNGILYNIIYYQSTNAQDYRERSKKGIYYQPTNVQYCRERSKKEIVLERLPLPFFTGEVQVLMYQVHFRGFLIF